jgi:hypothetical protein
MPIAAISVVPLLGAGRAYVVAHRPLNLQELACVQNFAEDLEGRA